MTPPLWQKSKEELKSLLKKVKNESEKVVLKLSIQKMKIMASGLITSWQIDGQTMETVIDFIFLGSKITAHGDRSHEINRCLFLGRKSHDKPRQCIKKQKRYFANKGLYSQSYGFSSSCVWMWELDHKEGWKLWYWRKLLKVPWITRRSNQSILKEINCEYWNIGRTGAETENPILRPPDVKSQLNRKDRDAGKDWR